MAVIKCPICGEQFEIDEKTADSAKCPVGHIVVLEQAAPELWQKLINQTAELENNLKDIVDEYEQTGDPKDIRTTIESYDKYREIRKFNVLWRDFILGATGVSAAKKDKEMQTYLKNAAKRFDSENESADTGLYFSILLAYPNVGTNVDWDGIIKQTYGDEAKFTVISENLINYIVKSQDKAFAMDIFYLLSAKEGEWASAGRIYLRTLLSSEEVAAKVFPRSAFNGRTKKFVLNVRSYCKKFLNDGNRITLDETKVWKNYTDACKYQKRRNIIIITSVLAVVLAVSLALFFYFNATDKESVEFNVDKVIETTYGDPLDLSEYTVTYKKNSGETVTEKITEKMLVGYDPEKIGDQTVYVVFEGVRTGITIHVNPATLKAPVLTQSGNYITWDYVPYATDYNVYINSSSTPTDTVTTLSYDLSTIANYGELSVTVRSNSYSEKYNNSAMSQPMTITKLQPPTNLSYKNGKLTWNEVTGASVYELKINGTPYTTYTNSYTIDFTHGNNEVTVIAKSDAQSVVEGVTNQTMYLLSPVSSMSYTDGRIYWEAESKATNYSIYVDGEYWKTIYSRKYFDVEEDGFVSEFGETQYTIGIICNSSELGTQPSDMVSSVVAIGNHAWIEDGTVHWSSVGAGAVYTISINGEETFSYGSPDLSLADVEWEEGTNTLSLTAKLNDKTVICETVTLIKHTKPTLTVSGGVLLTDGAENNTFSINGEPWSAVIPDLKSFTAGDYTIRAKRAASSQTAFEIDSDIVEFKVKKLAIPVFTVEDDKINSSYENDDNYTVSLYRYDPQSETFVKISGLNAIIEAGEHRIKATLSAGNFEGFDYIIESDFSAEITVTKLEAPLVYYEAGGTTVTSDSGGVIKFYYVQNGTEYELEGGRISSLPPGIFEIYARRIATNPNELTSENTPASKRVSVFNMSISLTINKVSSNQSQLYAVFDGCEGIDELTFSYELKYYNRDGKYIGNTPSSGEITRQKLNPTQPTIVATINYRAGAIFEQGYGQTDIYRVEMIVTLSSGGNSQTLAPAEMYV